MFMEVVLKTAQNYVTDVENPMPALKLNSEDMTRYTFAIRAYSFTRKIWTKDFQPFFEVLAMLRRENYFAEGMEYFYYSMLRDSACLLCHKIVFAEAEKT